MHILLLLLFPFFFLRALLFSSAIIFQSAEHLYTRGIDLSPQKAAMFYSSLQYTSVYRDKMQTELRFKMHFLQAKVMKIRVSPTCKTAQWREGRLSSRHSSAYGLESLWDVFRLHKSTFSFPGEFGNSVAKPTITRTRRTSKKLNTCN